VTEADALVLARAHFGEPAAVTGWLRQVHRVEAAPLRAEFWKQLGAVTLAFVWAMSLTYAVAVLVYVPVVQFPAAWEALRTNTELAMMPAVIVGILTSVTALVMFWALCRWLMVRGVGTGLNWLRWCVWLAGGIALSVAAIEVYGWLYGGWSFEQSGPGVYPRGYSGPGIFLVFLESGNGISYQRGLWGAELTVSALLAAMFVRRAMGPIGGMREACAGLVGWLAAAGALRVVIRMAVIRADLTYVQSYFAGDDFMSRLRHSLTGSLAAYSMFDVVIGAFLLVVVGAIVWRRGRQGMAGRVVRDVGA
jgi:uncharacterized membrane protein (DUF485 family)